MITFNPKLYHRAAVRAEDLGISFQEYVRHLVVSDTDKHSSSIPMVDDKTAELISQSLAEYHAGEVVTIDPNDEAQLDFAAGINT